MKFIYLFCFYLISINSFVSCISSDKCEESEFVSFASEGMVSDKEYVFDDFSELYQLSGPFEISITLRFSEACALKYLPLQIELQANMDSISSYQLNIDFFDNIGHSLGKGNYGIYELVTPLTKISDIDECFFVSLKTYESNTKGIISAGVIVKKV